MKTNNLIQHLKTASAVAAIAAGLALAGCNQPSATDNAQSAYALPALPPTLPLATGSATPVNDAPQATALPDVKPIAVSRVSNPGDAYAYADDAAGFQDALGDAPPDYGFDYEDVEPWAWQGYDDSTVFAEPIDDGYRYYYYRPGADEPYFVRDPDYGYGYADGSLAVVYGPGGAVVPYNDYGPRLTYASRYYARGHDLWQASRERQRRAVIAENWAARQNAIAASQSRWDQERAQQQAWQAYHDRVARQQADHWNEEQARRRADAVRFADWRQQDYRTPPPPRAIPATWTKHKWAQDQNRFAPPAPGFNGDAAQRAQAAHVEQQRLAALAERQRAAARQRQAKEQRAQQARQDAQDQHRAQLQQQRADQAYRADQAAQLARARAAQQQAKATQQRAQAEQQRLRDRAQQEQKARQDAARQQAAKAQQKAAAAQRAQQDRQNAEQARQQAARQQKAKAQAAQKAKADAAQRARAQAAEQHAQADERAKAQADQRAKTQAAAKAQAAQRAQAAQQRNQAAAAQRAQAAQRSQAAHARAQAPARPHPQAQPHQGGPAHQKRPDQH